MSNALAIAAVTATLRALLIRKLGIANVTARALDKAREGVTGDQVNLFLYQTAAVCTWRNMDMPRQLKPGETGHPPLPLVLSYLLTAYSDDKDDVKGQMLLGQAMGALHDHPLLDASEIEDATQAEVPGSDLHRQIERVRITLQPMPLDELSKLWTSFQASYRTSAAYQISVVLIESTRPAKAPLPVLERGKGDPGVASQPDLVPPFPTLLELLLPAGQSAVRLGEMLTLRGHHLDGDEVTVRLTNPHLSESGPLTIEQATASEIQVRLTDDPARWVAGLYGASVAVTNDDDARTTNELPLTVAPRITSALPLDVARQGDGSATIELSCSPRVLPGQRAALLLDGREVPAEPHPAATDSLRFIVADAPLGKHFLRLRIDGVDSLLVLRPPGQPPVFDPDQTVELHD